MSSKSSASCDKLSVRKREEATYVKPMQKCEHSSAGMAVLQLAIRGQHSLLLESRKSDRVQDCIIKICSFVLLMLTLRVTITLMLHVKAS